MDVEVGCLYRTVLDTEVMLSKLLIICKNGEGSPAAFDGSSEKRTCLDCATMDFFQLSQARIRNWGCFPGIWKRQEMLSALTYGYVRVEAWKLRVKLGMLLCRWVGYSQGPSVCGCPREEAYAWHHFSGWERYPVQPRHYEWKARHETPHISLRCEKF